MDFTVLKPVIKLIFDTVFVPMIKKYEDQIGVEAIKTLVEGITADLEAGVDKALS